MSEIVVTLEVSVPVIVEVLVEDESYEVLSVKLAEPDEVKAAVYEQCDVDLGELAEEEIARMREEDEENLDDE